MAMPDLIQRLVRARSGGTFYGRIPESNVLDPVPDGGDFAAEPGYFEIVLAQMFLRDRRELWHTYVPFALVVVDFLYRDRRETAPFLVGNRLLGPVETAVEGQEVEYLNTKVAGPIPYAGDDVALFVGLFRTPARDLAKSLFDLLQSVVGTFDVAQISSYLTLARSMTDGLSDLLGAGEVELRIGTRDEFSSQPGSARAFRSGYLAFINRTTAAAPDRLWVKGNRLHAGPDPERAAPYREHDFCLVQINRRQQRNDYAKLPFHRRWLEARQFVARDNVEQARATLAALLEEVVISPDLTDADRFDVQLLYKSNFDAEVARRLRLTSDPAERRAVMRSGGGRRGVEALSPQAMASRAANVAKRLGLATEVRDALLDMRDGWQKIPHLSERPHHEELSEDVFRDQLRALRRIRRVPPAHAEALARTLVIDAMTPAP